MYIHPLVVVGRYSIVRIESYDPTSSKSIMGMWYFVSVVFDE